MTKNEAVSYLESCDWSATRLGLERTRELLAALGDPQRSLRFVHVAGSNGKGSTCAMLDSVLRKAGYRTGLYTSPYIETFNERIKIDGESIPDEALAELTERVRPIADGMPDHPSQFELVTALAMLYFARMRCDIVVLEVGMGGALDSTNVIEAPEVAVITNIGLEHTEYLGDTLEKIAATKAGIIKPGCRCVCYDGAPEVTAIVERVCREQSVPLKRLDFSMLTPVNHSLDGQRFIWRGAEYSLPLLGEHQLHNAALALETIDALRERGFEIPPAAVTDGLADVRWPARFEVLSREPLFILDGGHNPQCAEAMADILADYLPESKVTFLMGVLADKDYEAMLAFVASHAASFVCVTPPSPRALAAEELTARVRAIGHEAITAESIPSGIEAALSTGQPVVAFGSLYMAGAVRSGFRAACRKHLRREGIKARDALTYDKRAERSEAIVRRILASGEFKTARTVLIYNSVRGEASLNGIITSPESAGKRLVYPLCVSRTELCAALPSGEDAWSEGAYGIKEPIAERSVLIAPEEIDLVICPCAAFDQNGGRIGMGAGYYDRYLPRCKNARVFAAAFECQRAAQVPGEPWDVPVEAVFTEEREYRKQRG